MKFTAAQRRDCLQRIGFETATGAFLDGVIAYEGGVSFIKGSSGDFWNGWQHAKYRAEVEGKSQSPKLKAV